MTAPPSSRASSYTALRQNFLDTAARHGAALFHYPHPLKGMQGEALFTDVARLGSEQASKWLVILSGTHGVEGYYGSMCQTAYLDCLAHRQRDESVGILMIHLINPWGTAWKRRVNEDNIDLNRNYLDFSAGLPANDVYETVHHLFTLDRATGQARQQTDLEWTQKQEELGKTGLKSKLGAGQYAHADGMFYGGKAASWSNQTLRAIMKRFVAGASDVISFDLHTGAGAYGHPMLMAIAEREYPGMRDAQQLYGSWLYKILTSPGQTTETGISAEATGYTSQAMIDLMQGTRFMQLVIECGTHDGATRGHKALLDDHFLHLGNELEGPRFEAVKREIMEYFYPADEDWRELTWVRSRQIFDKALWALAQR